MTEEIAAQENPPVGQVNGENAPEPRSKWSTVSGFIFRMMLMWMFMSWMRGGNKTEVPKDSSGASISSVPASNLFSANQMISMWVYINEEERFTQFKDTSKLFWLQSGLVYGDWVNGPYGDGSFTMNGTIKLSDKVKNNGSIFIHTFLTKDGFVPNGELEGDFDERHTVYRAKQLNRFKKRTLKKTQNLLTGTTDTDPEILKRAEEMGNSEILSHWHPNLTVNLVADQTSWTQGKIPAPLDQYVQFSSNNRSYEPIVYINDYWNLLREFTPINESLDEVNLFLTFQPISIFKLQMYLSQQMKSQWYGGMLDAGEDEEEQDTLKETMLETNPYLLGLTVIVSIVHSFFEFLAFKNDIQFWKSRKTLEGLSVRSVVFGVFQQVIVLLYVMDNDTNFVIKVSIFIGCLIDGWKITKVMSVSIDRENYWLGFIPKIKFQDKSTYVESETKKYDQLAFKYLGWACFPLLVAYAIYSLVYNEHKGFYSYILSILYGFLLTFGFIMMTPQLFINYKLKSVAHLPWRMLTYKALNTFIDDIFAFVIKMPTMYRIGCFRDDIVFFIYLYQRWAYRVDPMRVNEFGTSQEILEKNETQKTEAVTEKTEAATKTEEEKKKD